MKKDNISVNIYEGPEHALQDPPGTGASIFRADALLDIGSFIELAGGES